MNAHPRATRARTRMAGRAALERGSAALVSCIVEDLSPTGARVAFAAGVTIPTYFDLEFGPDRQSHHARTVWQRASTAGVMFLERRANAPEVLAD